MFHYPPECDEGIVGDVLDPVVGEVEAGEDPQGPQSLHRNLSQGIVCQVQTLEIMLQIYLHFNAAISIPLAFMVRKPECHK